MRLDTFMTRDIMPTPVKMSASVLHTYQSDQSADGKPQTFYDKWGRYSRK